MSKAGIGDIEKALIAYIGSNSPQPSEGQGKWQVTGISEQAVDEDASIILRAPAVLVAHGGDGGTYEPREITGTRYGIREPFALYVVSRYRKTMTDERGDAYSMIEDLKTMLAGQKITVSAGVDVFTWLVRPPQYVGPAKAGGSVWVLDIEVRGNWDRV